MNDRDISTIVRSAALEPEPGELGRIRRRLADDSARPLRLLLDGTPEPRSPVGSAVLVAAVAAFVVLAVGSVIAWRGDDDAPVVPATVPDASVAPDPAPPGTNTPAPTVLEDVDGTWLLVEVDGAAWSGPSIPFVRSDGRSLVGWDGCNGGEWSTPTADGLGAADTTLVWCATEVPEIFGATSLELGDDAVPLVLSGQTGEFGFVPLAVGTVPTLDRLVGTWEAGDTPVRWSIDPSREGLLATVGTCEFAVDLDDAVVTPVAGAEPPTECAGPDAAGLARALADPSRRILLVQIDDLLYLAVGADPSSISEVYALVRSTDGAPEEPIVDGVALDRGEVFGIGPDWAGATTPPAQSADDTLALIGGILGPVRADTGWYELDLLGADAVPNCLAGAEYRVLWWGDLSVAFRRVDGVELLWTWSVGDRRASGFGDRGEPAVGDTGPSSGLATEAGVGVGSSLDDLLDAYPGLIDTGQVDDDGTVVYVSDGGQWPGLSNSSIGFAVRDGLVTGYAATLSLC